MKKALQIELLERLIALHYKQSHQTTIDDVVHLPVAIYTDSDVFQREIESLFADFPLVVGHSSMVAKPGSYILYEWNGCSYVIVRDRSGVLRAFANTCRHRGARLVDSGGHGLRAFVCRYHGWTYNLDGSLRWIPRASAFPGVDKCAFSLRPLAVADYMGLIWLLPGSNESVDPGKYLGSFATDLRHFKIDEHLSFRKVQSIKNANWKLLIKTYLEGYHVPVLHQDTLAKFFRNTVLAYDTDGPNIRLCAARTDILDATSIPKENWNILDFASVYYLLFPNTFLIMHPDYVSINTFVPNAVDRTTWIHEMLYHPEVFSEKSDIVELEKRFRFTNDVVFDNEDFEIAEQVQANLASGVNDSHLLGLDEGLIKVFQDSIEERTR